MTMTRTSSKLLCCALGLVMKRSLLSRASYTAHIATRVTNTYACRLCAGATRRLDSPRLLATHAPLNGWSHYSAQPEHHEPSGSSPFRPALGSFTSNSRPGHEPNAGKPSEQDNLANFGKTLETITAHLPALLQEGHLPTEILSPNIALELLPATMRSIGPIPLPVALQVPFPEIRGLSAYMTASRIGCWCVNLLFGPSTTQANFSLSGTSSVDNAPLSLAIETQQLLGSYESLSDAAVDRNSSASQIKFERLAPTKQKLIIRFRLVANDTSRPLASRQTTLTTGLFHFHFDEHGKISRHVLEVLEQRHSRARYLARSWSKLWWAAAVRAAKRTASGKKEPALGWACADHNKRDQSQK
ncbi:hypothetical protein BCR37DRAFT_110935 [Protomyces lactucae-debilis]|uniref:Uncharacterized protein n=1 Tax=Protomyces lactucae-debilis TaxID=2754530 RepID=A0A1Y2F480_PROLT|nr:uncharacterized protein BCR37DRAFT_110935 [Protomyces lactucae-debilis]ORY78663.1 hypothetical protein BCR37DRAFT_110935 [Protomyces lactucae-debilis]